MYDDVLIPTDGEDRIERVIERGVDIAVNRDATVHALAVVDDRAFLTLDDALVDEVAEELEIDGERAVSSVADRAEDAGVAVTTATRRGDPAEEIRAYAAENDVDLIVMGARSDDGRERALPGSVSQKVVSRATTPVLTVPLLGE